MKYPDLFKGFISIESALFIDDWLSTIQELPYYNPKKIKANILHLSRQEIVQQQNKDLLQSIQPAVKQIVLSNNEGITHGDLTDLGILATEFFGLRDSLKLEMKKITTQQLTEMLKFSNSLFY